MLIRKVNKQFLAAAVVLLLIVSTAIFAQTVKIKIIQTTDDHGAIYQFDFTDQKPVSNSLAQVYSYIKQERTNKNQEVILLSGGDILQGTPVVYYYNFEKTGAPHLLAEVMNFMKYDAGTVGNHDIETGHDVYDRFVKEINFPWLAANAIDVKLGKPYFKPYTIIERKGIRIAVLGLITPNIPNWLPEKIWEGIIWEDMIESASKWVDIIKNTEKPDLLIGLFHSGVEYTYNNQTADTYKNENASKLVAQKVPGFDIIFTGHDHQGWNFLEKNSNGEKVLVIGGTSSAKDIAVANALFVFDEDSKDWKKEIVGELIDARKFEPEAEFMKRFNYGFDEVMEYVSRPIGNFSEAVSSRESIFGPSAFTDLVNKIQLELTGADISFAAPLSMNALIEKGRVLAGKMFSLYRYENLLYTMELTGKEIKDYLEYSYGLWFAQMKKEDDHLLNFSRDEKGEIKFDRKNNLPMLAYPFYSFDCAAGIFYTVDVSKPAGERVDIKSMSDGLPFRLDKKYKVAINSYRGNGGGGHLVSGACIPKEKLAARTLSSTDKDLRFYLMKWIEKSGTVTPVKLNNWQIIPAEWWKKGMEKDYRLLFGKNN